jgi:hypothetical protein
MMSRIVIVILIYHCHKPMDLKLQVTNLMKKVYVYYVFRELIVAFI